MGTTFVIDACTMINLLRIDDDDDFLYKNLESLDIHITDIVCDEIKNNIFRNTISADDKKRLNTLLPFLASDLTYHLSEDIIKHISNDVYEKIKIYANHTKKDNGELISMILSLYLSRQNKSKVIFYTDDFPAKDEFEKTFMIHQIGTIEDSVDLLLFLYWLKRDFTLPKLKEKLKDLISEYNSSLKGFVNCIKDLDLKKERQLKKLLNEITDEFYDAKMDKFFNVLNKIKHTKNKSVRKILDDFPDLEKRNKLIDKVYIVLKELDSTVIYKTA